MPHWLRKILDLLAMGWLRGAFAPCQDRAETDELLFQRARKVVLQRELEYLRRLHADAEEEGHEHCVRAFRSTIERRERELEAL